MNDYVDVHTSGGAKRFVEGDDGWWLLEGAPDDWRLVEDPEHGFLTAFETPHESTIELGSVFVTARGRRLAIASITMKDEEVRIMLMPAA
jgi:hypothetical protein